MRVALGMISAQKHIMDSAMSGINSHVINTGNGCQLIRYGGMDPRTEFLADLLWIEQNRRFIVRQ